MRIAEKNDLCDVECPHCGAALDVDDPDDFDESTSMEREGDIDMICPVCDGIMMVHVTWEPTYPYDAEAVI